MWWWSWGAHGKRKERQWSWEGTREEAELLLQLMWEELLLHKCSWSKLIIKRSSWTLVFFLYFLAFMALGGARLRRTWGVSWSPGGASPGSSMCTVMIWDDKWDEPLLFEVKSTQWKITNSSRLQQQQLNCKKTPHAALLLLPWWPMDPTVIATITFRLRISRLEARP